MAASDSEWDAYKVLNEINDDDETSVLHRACGEGNHVNEVLALLQKGLDVDATDILGVTPLCYAARNGNEGIARVLLARGASIEVNGVASALAAAAEGGLGALVRDLVEVHGANVDGIVDDPRDSTNYTPCTALWLAASNGHLAIVRYLADHGADINAVAFFDTSPLCAACMHSHVDVANELLSRGAHMYNRFGESVAEVAKREGVTLTPEVASLLL